MAEQSNTFHFCPWTHHVNSSTMYCVLFKLKFQICFRTWPTLSIINFGWCCSTVKEEYIWWISTSGFIHTCWIAENIWLKKYSCISTWEQNFSKNLPDDGWTKLSTFHFLPWTQQHQHNCVHSSQLELQPYFYLKQTFCFTGRGISTVSKVLLFAAV